ncbi:hypothetical protein HG537_0F02080 [Torulaspora globosa]|uniref:DUF1749-domain-containing protein n=1 Tax=Torulaspora globosa TaxID=48254 RepID=A0A7H9HXC9_9SACH|nr:hypothetical protein HG537_0F02080 [Torulaspora sp. CBS 2947]
MGTFRGLLHQYCHPQVAFEFEPSGCKKVIIVIGGLTDGLLTVDFGPSLAEAVSQLGYSVVNIQMSSSYKGWGITSLDSDINEIRQLVSYLRCSEGGSRETIIILGRSTGSQDVIRYLLRYPETVDAGIMNAAVSDREGLSPKLDPSLLKRLNAEAERLVDDGKSNQVLGPMFAKAMFDTPVTAYRWCSLMLPGGDDDYFSSDLTDDTLQRTFGKIEKPFLVLENDNDEFVPKTIDKSALLERWKKFSHPTYWSKHSGWVTGASHVVSEPEGQQNLNKLVISFIKEFSL